MAVLDLEGCLLYANPAAEVLLGLPSNDLAGASFGFPIVRDTPVELQIRRRSGDSVAAEMRLVEVAWADEQYYLLSLRETAGLLMVDQAVNRSRDRLEVLVNKWKRADEAMQVSKEWLHRFSRAHRIGFYEWSEQRGLIYFSPEVYELLGCTPGLSVTLEKIIARVHRDDREMLRRGNVEACEKATGRTIVSAQREFRVVHENGSVLWLEAMAMYNFEADDLIVRGAVRDISERKQAETALLASEAKYRDLVENANSIIIRWDLKGNITFFNEFAEMFFGYRASEVLGKNVVGTIVPESESTGRNLAAMIRDIQLNTERYKTNVNENVRRYGERVWISWTNKAIRDAQENLTEIQSVGNDITERKLAEEALRKSEASLARSQAIARLASWEVDVGTGQVRVSDEFYRIFNIEPGTSQEAFIVKLHPGDRARVLDAVNAAIYEGKPYNIDYRIIPCPGEVRHIHAEGETTRDRTGRPLSFFGTVQDITDRKRAEKELADAKALAELYLDLMGHDINNMNMVAAGFLEVAKGEMRREDMLETASASLLDKALESVSNSSRLISNVRKLQSRSSGQNKSEVYDLCVLIEGVAAQLKSVPERRVEINVSTVAGIRVQANELLRDVFANLIGNSIKHSDGHASIDIQVTSEDGTDGRLYGKVAIDDNGPGVPDEMKEKIFNRLSRGNTGTKGSGLGLYLVKSLVDSYDGQVWVENRVPGDHTKGARFVVILPAVKE